MELELLKIAAAVVGAPLMAFLGYLGVSVRSAHARLNSTLREEQVRQLIDDKMEIVRAQNDAISSRIRTLELKMDRLIDLAIRSSHKD